jgi:hypothetical protein
MEVDRVLVLMICASTFVHGYRRGVVNTVFFLGAGVSLIMVYELWRRSRANVRTVRRDQTIRDRLIRHVGELHYVIRNHRLTNALSEIRFVRRFSKTAYRHYAHAIEECLRLYRDAIRGHGVDFALVKGAYEDTHEIAEEILMQVPEYSRRLYRFGDRSLHDVLRVECGVIETILRGLVKRIAVMTEKKTSAL